MRAIRLTLGLVLLTAALLPAAEFNLGVKTSNVKLGKVLMNKVEPADLDGRVVLVEFWGINCGPCLESLPKVSLLNKELSPFGLLVVGAHAQKGTPEKIVSVARSRGVNFPIVQSASVEGGNDFNGIPHCMLFDHTGKCLYRGHPGSVEKKLRAAVGEALVAGSELSKADGKLGQIVASLKRGDHPAAALKQALPLLKATDSETAKKAAKLVDGLTARGVKDLDAAEKAKESDPVEAYDLASKVAAQFKGAPVATKATAMVTELKKDGKIAVELKARPILEKVQALDATLTARVKDKVDPTSAEFHQANAVFLNQMRGRLANLQKTAPDSRATAEAVEIGKKYGLGSR